LNLPQPPQKVKWLSTALILVIFLSGPVPSNLAGPTKRQRARQNYCPKRKKGKTNKDKVEKREKKEKRGKQEKKQ